MYSCYHSNYIPIFMVFWLFKCTYSLYLQTLSNPPRIGSSHQHIFAVRDADLHNDSPWCTPQADKGPSRKQKTTRVDGQFHQPAEKTYSVAILKKTRSTDSVWCSSKAKPRKMMSFLNQCIALDKHLFSHEPCSKSLWCMKRWLVHDRIQISCLLSWNIPTWLGNQVIP